MATVETIFIVTVPSERWHVALLIVCCHEEHIDKESEAACNNCFLNCTMKFMLSHASIVMFRSMFLLLDSRKFYALRTMGLLVVCRGWSHVEFGAHFLNSTLCPLVDLLVCLFACLLVFTHMLQIYFITFYFGRRLKRRGRGGRKKNINTAFFYRPVLHAVLVVVSHAAPTNPIKDTVKTCQFYLRVGWAISMPSLYEQCILFLGLEC